MEFSSLSQLKVLQPFTIFLLSQSVCPQQAFVTQSNVCRYGLEPIQDLNTHTAIIYESSEKARVFVPGGPPQPSLMFAGRVRSLSIGSCFTWIGSSLPQKHQTRQERHAREKPSSLLQIFINYNQNSFAQVLYCLTCYSHI